MKENNLLKIFEEIIKSSRNAGYLIPMKYKEGIIKLPKQPTNEQTALYSLISNMDDESFEQLNKSLKYCIDLSLFKLLDLLENGISEYSFNLTIKDQHNHSLELINDDLDNQISQKFWEWVDNG